MNKYGAILLMAVLVMWAPMQAAAQDRRSWDWEGRVDRGDAIEIKGINGEILAERGSGNEVVVRVEMKGKRDSDPAEIEMVVLEHGDGVTICAVYPADEDERPNECQPGGRARTNVRDHYNVEVEFTVTVPDGVDFIGRTVNGGVDARGIEGDVYAHTVNGSIDIYATGVAEAGTVNGSITVSMGRADWDGTLDFSTVNGGVTLEMPSDLSTEVSVSTVNGQISSDFPLTVEGRFSPRHLKGTIGGGGRSLVIKTVNGSIQIRRS
jgi:DUF4097 and DUF4098 domain-containing protein YvlB